MKTNPKTTKSVQKGITWARQEQSRKVCYIMGLTTTGVLLCRQLMGSGAVVFSGQVRKRRFGVTGFRNLCCLPLCFCEKRQISWQWDCRHWGIGRAEAKVSLKTRSKWWVAACFNRQYHSNTPAQWLALFPHSKKVLDSRPGWGKLRLL